MAVEHIKKNAGWVIWETLKRAVVPKQDIVTHDLFNENCQCNPKWDDFILVHNALDGRTQYEVKK